MKVIKRENEFGLNVIMGYSDKFLAFSLGSDDELCWSYYRKKTYPDDCFIITRENACVYNLFMYLFCDIERMANSYSGVFDKNAETITWCSESIGTKAMNYVTIHREDDSFKLDFYTINKDDEKKWIRNNYVSIRFPRSNSVNDSVTKLFYEMYYNMKNLEDVWDDSKKRELVKRYA